MSSVLVSLYALISATLVYISTTPSLVILVFHIMAPFSKYPGRNKRNRITGQKKRTYGRAIAIKDGDKFSSSNSFASNDEKISEIFIVTGLKKPGKRQGIIANYSAQAFSAANLAIEPAELGAIKFRSFRLPGAVNIDEYGDWDKSPETARTSHLNPVINFIKRIGYKPLANDFIFDKSGFGQYMFNANPDRTRMLKAINEGEFPRQAFVLSIKQNRKYILFDAIALLLRRRFKFPASIEVGDNGFVYDNGNAIQIGFSNLSEHPMLRKRK